MKEGKRRKEKKKIISKEMRRGKYNKKRKC